jgi:prepilin-type N-terminal cleavage/methylation domain-containing protein
MNKKGFTLMELLVLVAILGIFATLSIKAIENARLKVCANGEYSYCENMDMSRSEAIEKLKEGGYNNKNENLKKCKKECAKDYDIDLNDCLKRCEIINN